ncbi:MAG: hypothetical protein R2710_30640 [Acidimicrobiales bacterium]
MKATEKDRLDLRQELERVFSNKRFAEIAMEAMPPIDYDRLATKDDVAALGVELRGEMAVLRGEMAELRGDMKTEIVAVRGEIVTLGRQLLLGQLTTMVMLGAWVAALN